MKLSHSFKTNMACVVALLAAASVARATEAGLSTDPMNQGWDRNDPNSGFAIWDTFPNVGAGAFGPGSNGTFSGAAPGSTFGLSSPLLDQSTEGPLRLGGGDRIYGFGTEPLFTITLSTAFAVKGFVLQMKQHSASTDFALLYLPLLNGFAADFVLTSPTYQETVGADTFNQQVTTWWWGDSLASSALTALTLDITAQEGTHTSVDGLTIDAGTVSVVPEPSAIALLGGAGLLFLMRRRRCLALA